MWFIIIFLVLIPPALFIANALLNRISGIHPHRTPFTAGYYANLFFLPLYVVLHCRVFEVQWFSLLCGLVFAGIYLNCMIFLNWFIFALTDASMHIQLMTQIYKSGSIPKSQLVERYNKHTILSNRVPRLLELRQLRLENGRLFTNGSSVLFAAKVCVLVRRILGIPARPEDADHLTS